MFVSPHTVIETNYNLEWENLANPCWLKEWIDDEEWPRMLMVNNAYVNTYGIGMKRYPGKTDMEMWGNIIGIQFSIFDYRAILKSPKRVIDSEYIPSKTGNTYGDFMKVSKQAFRDNRAQRWLIAGECRESG